MVALGTAQLLLENATVTSLAPGGINPILLPNKASYPAVTYQTISTVRTYTNDGPLGLIQTRVQIDCWGKTYQAVQPLALAITAVLDGFVGTLPNGVMVQDLQQDDCHETYEPDDFLFRIQADWLVFSEQA